MSMHVVEFQDELKKAVSAKANKHSYSDDFEDDDDEEDGKNDDDGGDDDGRYRMVCLSRLNHLQSMAQVHDIVNSEQ